MTSVDFKHKTTHQLVVLQGTGLVTEPEEQTVSKYNWTDCEVQAQWQQLVWNIKGSSLAPEAPNESTKVY